MELNFDWIEKIKLSDREVYLISAVIISLPFGYRQFWIKRQKAAVELRYKPFELFSA